MCRFQALLGSIAWINPFFMVHSYAWGEESRIQMIGLLPRPNRVGVSDCSRVSGEYSRFCFCLYLSYM